MDGSTLVGNTGITQAPCSNKFVRQSREASTLGLQNRPVREAGVEHHSKFCCLDTFLKSTSASGSIFHCEFERWEDAAVAVHCLVIPPAQAVK